MSSVVAFEPPGSHILTMNTSSISLLRRGSLTGRTDTVSDDLPPGIGPSLSGIIGPDPEASASTCGCAVSWGVCTQRTNRRHAALCESSTAVRNAPSCSILSVLAISFAPVSGNDGRVLFTGSLAVSVVIKSSIVHLNQGAESSWCRSSCVTSCNPLFMASRGVHTRLADNAIHMIKRIERMGLNLVI